MITAVDTSILLDVFLADPVHGPASREAMRSARAEGSLVACEIVWAEVAPSFPSGDAATGALDRLHVGFSPCRPEAALASGPAWKAYRARRGPRQRVIADFLIGAHALLQADRLLTRDRGFYRRYFRELRVVDPSVPGGRRR